jgi:hypothetical protein
VSIVSPEYGGQGSPFVPRDLRAAIWEVVGAYLLDRNDPLSWGLAGNVLSLEPASLNAATWAGANEARYSRVVGRGTISKLRVHVATQSGSICLGVYRGSGPGDGLSARPTTRKATTGSIACPATGVQDVALPTAVLLDPGDFLAMSCDNTTAAFLCAGAFGASAVFSGLLFVEASAHPLPATASPTAHNYRQPVITCVP